MFFTRWITHYCAPVFIFLSGTSAFLSLSKKNSKKDAAIGLLTRGLWLIVLELTIVRFGWQFNFDFNIIFVQVIWAIGCSMIVLSGLIFLPVGLIAAIGLVMIFGHNALDGIKASDAGGIWWNILHEQAFVPYGDGNTFAVLYPIIPWIGVMAAGYCFGKILQQEKKRRNVQCFMIGGAAVLFFVLLRWTNIYGDSRPWIPQSEWWKTVLSFVNCTKYPPSLLYLLMTLGPAIFILPLLEGVKGWFATFVSVYGRVPLFYYIMHLYVIHGMALLVGLCLGFPLSQFTAGGFSFNEHCWGFDLGGVYLFWALAIAILYFPCRWFMKVKMNYKKWWLSYL